VEGPRVPPDRPGITGPTVLGRARLQPGRHDPDEPRALAPEGPAHATGETSAPEIESQRTARRREQASVFPPHRYVQPRKTPSQSNLKRLTPRCHPEAVESPAKAGDPQRRISALVLSHPNQTDGWPIFAICAKVGGDETKAPPAHQNNSVIPTGAKRSGGTSCSA
jgi:hypothetical protein